ncbi:glycosyltransferase family 2 protein [Wolinella succinogenes]|uniref:glycosyltransferase family 2 protein n=1 Tax=Wolinella succinogenes TaxID=844 RepID=UPI002409EF23|nr:glycosyltransferase family 2 protein [Wolinella succinogenes]
MAKNKINDPLISVVIPMFNRSKTIKRCLDSVCSQTYSNLEVIVVDDCSTDNSTDVVENYSDNRVRLVKLEKNSGAQAARNNGILNANGEWIAFLDSDDTWEVQKLEKQLKELEKNQWNPMTVVHGNCFCLDESTSKKWILNLPVVEGYSFERLLSAPSPMFPALLTSKKALLDIGLLDESVPSYQEWDTAIRLSQKCQFIHLNEPLFTYHFHEGETISKNKKRDIDGYEYIIKKFKEQMIHNKSWNKHIINLYYKSVDIGDNKRSSNFICELKVGKWKIQLLSYINNTNLRSFKIIKYLLRKVIK